MNALGIDLGGTKIAAVLLGPDGHTLWQQRVATPAGDYDATLRAVAALVDAARTANGAAMVVPAATAASLTTVTTATTAIAAAALPSIGIGTPGTRAADGRMKNCNSTCLNGRPLHHDLETLLGQPVALANDANCLALSEATDGAGAGAHVVFAAILGTGVGAGIAVGGRVLCGPNGLAGEWGHNPLPWARGGDDPLFDCYCGQRGCIETLLSGTGLARDHAALHGGSLRGEDIAARAAAGDAACAATLERHAQRLARALAAVINLLDPDVIVLGGGLSRLPHLYDRVPALWGDWVFAGGLREPVHSRLVASLHGDASGVRGAAWLGRAASAGRA